MTQFDNYSVGDQAGAVGHKFHAEIGGGNLNSKFDLTHIDVPPADAGHELGYKISVGVGGLLGHKFHVEVGGNVMGHRFFIVTPRALTHYMAASLSGTTHLVARKKGVLKFDETQDAGNQDSFGHKFHVFLPIEDADLKHYIAASSTGTTHKITREFGVNVFRIETLNESVDSNEKVQGHRFRVFLPEFDAADYHYVAGSSTGTTHIVTRTFGVNKFIRVGDNNQVQGHRFRVFLPEEDAADYYYIAGSSTGTTHKVTRIPGVNKMIRTSPNEHYVGHKFHVFLPAWCPEFFFVGASMTGTTEDVARILGVDKFNTGSPGADLAGVIFTIPGIDVDHTKPEDLGQTFGHKFSVRGALNTWCMPPEFGVFEQETDWPKGDFDVSEDG